MKDKLKNTDLRVALASAKKELQEILGRAEHLREWIAVTEKLCAKRGKNAMASDEPMVPGTRRTKASVLATYVIEVLLTAGKPLHVETIVAELQKAGHPVTAINPKAAVAVALSRRPEIFAKVAPNTFGIAEKAEKIAS